jgi:hypothetical protein
VQGSFAPKMGNCLVCDSYKLALSEEGSDLTKVQSLLDKLIGAKPLILEPLPVIMKA